MLRPKGRTLDSSDCMSDTGCLEWILRRGQSCFASWLNSPRGLCYASERWIDCNLDWSFFEFSFMCNSTLALFILTFPPCERKVEKVLVKSILLIHG